MKNRNIGLNTRIVMPVVTVITTIIITLVLKPKDSTSLYWINLCIGIFLESLLFVWLAFSRTETIELSSVFKAVSGGLTLYYVLISFLVMIVYSTVFYDIVDIKWYISILLVLILIWYIFGSLVAYTDNKTISKENKEKEAIVFDVAKISSLRVRFSLVFAKFVTEGYMINPMEKLQHKMQFISPNVLRNANTVAKLNLMIENCECLLIKMESSVNKEDFINIEKELKQFINISIQEIDNLKKITRS